MNLMNLAFLGIVTGFTIFLGLPIARMSNVSSKTKSRLNAISVGILVFLLVDVLSQAMDATKNSVLLIWTGHGPLLSATIDAGVLLLGLILGLLGLVWYESRFIQNSYKKPDKNTMNYARAKQMAAMIALGIGFHNFSEGLAIGQSYASGAMGIAFLLVIGFALHNATEGFGIAAPLSGFKPDWVFLVKLGLIGGGPTLIGTLLGSVWTSTSATIFFFALAGGAIIYVVKEMLYHGRLQGEGMATMACVLIGFFIGFGTDLIVAVASGG